MLQNPLTSFWISQALSLQSLTVIHEAALRCGVKVTGATVHYVNEIPDGGEIILQKAVNIRPGDTPELLQRRVMEQAEWKLLPRAAELVCRRLMREKGKRI